MISILLATYNGERYIEQSITSVLNQTFTEFELLIGFNGTTDGSKEIVASFNDSRIRVFDYGEDKGKATTLNKLLKEVKYDWIAIQDDDDVWADSKLEKQVAHTTTNDIIGITKGGPGETSAAEALTALGGITSAQISGFATTIWFNW